MMRHLLCLARHRLYLIWHYLKGELWCRRLHRPLFSNVGGYGGKDAWGRHRMEYYGLHCVVCDNRWQKNGQQKDLTPEQRRVLKNALGEAWRGDDE